ncbi:MAG: alpha-hydroxy acid oxidase [Candidatus Acidiferrales bacterium]
MDRRQLLETLVGVVAGMIALPARGLEAFLPVAEPPSEAPSPVNLLEYEPLARERLSQMAYEYIAGGAADEITIGRNREAFSALRLKPRVLRDVSQLDTRLELFGQTLDFPILLAPTAYHKLVHTQGEAATARGAGAAGATLVVSSFATTAVEEISKAASKPLWFQLYVQPDRAFTRDLVQRAEAAGCRALCITVDTPVAGTRDREKRLHFSLPPGMDMENLKAMTAMLPRSGHLSDSAIYSIILDPTLTWETVDWIRSFAKVPVVLKGILAPEDARLAADHGAAAVLVSNHGGRNLDTTPATIEALPAVIEAVEDRIPVLMDGGVRRGTDVLKALALGAKAVLIGRPYLWGLAVNGAEGVQRVVDLLRTEFEAAMALCGTPTLKQIDRNALWPTR